MEIIKITTSQNVEIDYAVAGIGARVKARVIDYAVFFGIYMVCIFTLLALIGISHGLGRNDHGFAIIIIVWLVLCVFYDLLAEVFFNGQSIGKRMAKIKVISLNGARPGIGQYILRWIFRIIDFGFTFGSLAVVTVALSDKKQRLGDMVAGTTVVKTEPVTLFKDLIFKVPEADHLVKYPQVLNLTDRDITLIHDVIKNFNSTRNSLLIYKLAINIKKYLHISYPREINEYQFLEIVVKDYTYLIANGEV
jgi:uncharacterized RDD family membrane protein YckC